MKQHFCPFTIEIEFDNDESLMVYGVQDLTPVYRRHARHRQLRRAKKLSRERSRYQWL